MGIRAGPGSDPSQAGYLDKPLGYSLFPKEIAQVPPHWAEKLGKLVWSKVHKGVSICCPYRPCCGRKISMVSAR